MPKKTIEAVYFIQCATTQLIKIGKVTMLLYETRKILEPVRRRFDQLAVGSTKLELICVTIKYTETELHKIFNHLRQHGEWFRPENDLLDLLHFLTKTGENALVNPEKYSLELYNSLISEVNSKKS